VNGLLGLIGGREHGAGCEEIDRHVMDACEHDDPVVAVLPFASSLRTRARTIGRAVGWWERLGATTVVAGPDVRSTRRLLERADVIVMTGGVPDRLHQRLVDGALGVDVVARWRAGGHLIGSSSGAMVMASARQTVRPPFSVLPGLSLLSGVAIAPHHEQGLPRAIAAWRSRTHPHTLILGIDEATGLVGTDGRFRVLGVGTVVARRGTWQRTFRRGDSVCLRRLGAMSPVPDIARRPLTSVPASITLPPVTALHAVPTGDAAAEATPS
jgi:cyanophycinase-like exopeptidase